MTANTAAPEAQLARALQTLFVHQARELTVRAGRLLDGGDPYLGLDAAAMLPAVRPYLLRDYQRGMSQAAAAVATTRSLARRGVDDRPWWQRRRPAGVLRGPQAPAAASTLLANPAAALAGHVAKAAGLHRVATSPRRLAVVSKAVGSRLGISFDLVSPKVFAAVDGAAMTFCAETNATALLALADSIHRLRELLKKGLARGEAVGLLARRIRKIFADPYRAWRIATTESSRAVHEGARLEYKESGVVERQRWLASSDACERCLALDGKEVGLDEPFLVDPKGGPYAVVKGPPLHPFCQCSSTPVLG